MCTLSYVHLQTPHMAQMKAFYFEQMGMSQLSDIGAETILLSGRARQILLVSGERAALKEIGLEVAASRWREASKLLRNLGAVTVEQHSMFKKALSISDPDGNRMVFGAGSRQKKRVNRQPSLIARLQHFGLGSARIAELVSFYQNKIGFALSDYVTGEDRKLRSTFLRGSEEHHLLAVFGNGQPGLDHFSFEAEDWNGIRDWADHFARFGTKIFWGAGRHGVGNNLFIFVHDPDGNMVEISAELEQVPFGKPAGHWSFDYKAFNLWGPAAIRV
jgi:catechol 2,3-dioxygenase